MSLKHEVIDMLYKDVSEWITRCKLSEVDFILLSDIIDTCYESSLYQASPCSKADLFLYARDYLSKSRYSLFDVSGDVLISLCNDLDLADIRTTFSTYCKELEVSGEPPTVKHLASYIRSNCRVLNISEKALEKLCELLIHKFKISSSEKKDILEKLKLNIKDNLAYTVFNLVLTVAFAHAYISHIQPISINDSLIYYMDKLFLCFSAISFLIFGSVTIFAFIDMCSLLLTYIKYKNNSNNKDITWRNVCNVKKRQQRDREVKISTKFKSRSNMKTDRKEPVLTSDLYLQFKRVLNEFDQLVKDLNLKDNYEVKRIYQCYVPNIKRLLIQYEDLLNFGKSQSINVTKKEIEGCVTSFLSGLRALIKEFLDDKMALVTKTSAEALMFKFEQDNFGREG